MMNVMEFEGEYKAVIVYDPETYQQAGIAARAQGLSLNQWISQAVKKAASA